jgi:hypothetical protein
MTPQEAARHWVREREAVRLRREAGGAPPWTDDPIIGKYRFCNVRREDDAVTVWIHQHIREPFADHPDLWFMLAIARWINWPGTLGELIANGERDACWPGSPGFAMENLAQVLNARQRRGDKVFTGAYTINAPSTKGASKIDYVAGVVLGAIWRDREKLRAILERSPTLRDTHAALTKYQGWGAFMAYQVVVDLRFTRYLRDAEDVTKWAAAGPGTIRGLNRLAGRPVDKALEQWKALQEMRALFEVLPSETGVAMDLSDIPNVLCETDKYLRVLNGEGAPRAVYRPQAYVPTGEKT